MADGTKFEIDVAVKAAGVADAAAAVASLGERLAEAGTSSTAAADAVKAGQAAFKEAEGNAVRAAAAVERLGLAADEQRAKMAKLAASGDTSSKAYQAAAEKLSQLTTRQGEASAKADAATAAVAREAASLDKLSAAASAARTAQASLATQVDKAKAAHVAATKAHADATKTAAEAAKIAAGSGQVNEIAEGLGKIGGPIADVGGRALGLAEGFKKMRASLGNAGPYAAAAAAIVAVAAAIAAATAAAIAGVAAVAAWAVTLGDAARSQALLAQGLTQSVAGGKALDAFIGRLQNRVPLTRDALLGLAKPLVDAGLQGKALEEALEAAAAKAATVKFGPGFAAEMRSLPNLTARLQRNFSRIFSGLKIEPLLAALEKMVDLFDEGTASSKAISVVFESLFQPLIDGVTEFQPKAAAAFIQFEIQVLKALIAIKPFAGYILVAVGVVVGLAAVITGALAFAIAGVVLSIGVASAALGVVLGVMAAAAAATAYLGAKLFELAGVVQTAIRAAFDWLASVSLAEIATGLIDGLINGITNAAPRVLAAMKGLAGGAINAAKSALGIKSPSTVFAEIGMYTAEGMTQGVDSEAGAVASSLESMVAPPEPAAAGAAPSGPSAGGGGPVFNITVSGGGSAQSIADAIRDAIADLLVQSGGAVVANG